MNINWKKTAGAIVLVAIIAGSTSGAMADKPKRSHTSGPIIILNEEGTLTTTRTKAPAEVNAPPTETPTETERTSKDQGVESGREKAPDAAEAKGETPPSTERGIKDNGVKQCGKCGITSGRIKAPGTGPRTPNNILMILGGLAAAGGIAAAASGGNDTPTSP